MVDLETVKSILKIRDSFEDTTIEMLIPMVEKEIMDYCNIDTLTIYPMDLQLAACKIIGYHLANNNMVASEKNGDISVTFLEDYPSDIKRILKKYRKLDFS